MPHTEHRPSSVEHPPPGPAERGSAVRAEVESIAHELTVAVRGLPSIPNEFGGDATPSRLRVFFSALADGVLRPIRIEFLHAETPYGYFLAPVAWEQPDGWPTWLRDFADHLTPGRSGARPSGVEVTVERHLARVVLSVANMTPATGPDGQEVPVAKVALGYVDSVSRLIRFTLVDGTDLFVTPAALEQPDRLPHPLRQLVDEFRPAACGI